MTARRVTPTRRPKSGPESAGQPAVCRDRLDAELYSSLHRGTPGDVEYYVAQCRDADTILELGAGYGRLSSALALAGHRVTGLELDSWLLRQARSNARVLPAAVRSRLHLLRGNMTRFDLGSTFDRIVIAHSTLYCLGSDRALASCLRAARRHLAPDGVLLADVYAADGFHRRAHRSPEPDATEPIVGVTLGASTWQVWERSRWQYDRRRFVVEYVCRRQGSRPLERILTLRHRYRLRAEIESALARAGFDRVQIRGGFSAERYSSGASNLVLCAWASGHE
jgi:SAM-dependent methyltransferase